mgnify:CR=1 FL=1
MSRRNTELLLLIASAFPVILLYAMYVLTAGATITGFVDDGYWLDLGRPLDFVQGSRDLVNGRAPSPALPGPVGDVMVMPGAEVASSAVLRNGTFVKPAH